MDTEPAGEARDISTTLASLSRRRMVIVTGKGGVGKSAISAALGERFAALGRKVLVLEVDPRENVHQMFGIPPSGGEIVEVREGLYLQNLKPRQVLDDIIREQVKLGPVARRVLESPLYEQFAAGMPGLKEVALANHALRLTDPGKADAFDVVVLDAPATGHGVSLLAAPLLVAETIPTGPVGRMARQLADLVADPRNSSIVVVTLAEEMPVDEALELRAMLRERLGREPELLVANGLYPPYSPGTEEGSSAPGDGARELWRQRRRINDEELARLRERWQGTITELPLLPIPPGPRLIAALAAALTAGPGFDASAAASEETGA